MAGPTKKDPNRLVVEGKDDQWSVIRLLERNQVVWDKERHPEIPWVHDSNGYQQLLDSLEVSARTYQKLGVLIDANEHPSQRWQQVRDRFAKEGITLPEEPSPDGTIVEGIRAGSKIGVWLMPDNSQPGMLEDFLADLVPEEDDRWPYAEEVTKGAQGKGASFPEAAFMKARIHTWLAWQEEPGLPYGTALTAQYFGADSPSALAFVSWFRRLFFEEPGQ